MLNDSMAMKCFLKIISVFFALMITTTAPVMADTQNLDKVSVYLVPLNDFPEALAFNIARTLSKDLNFWIKSSLRLGELGIEPMAGTNQLAVEDILAKSQSVLKNLPEASDKTYFVILTTRDINNRSANFRFQFSSHDKRLNTSVVSIARMLESTDGKTINEALSLSRFMKMLLRAIGEMHLGWKRSVNPKDIMYSPIMGVTDLDRLEFNHVPEPENNTPEQKTPSGAGTI